MITITIGDETWATTEHPSFAIPLIEAALDLLHVPHTAARHEWLAHVEQDLLAHQLHPTTCYGRVAVSDTKSPATHAEWAQQARRNLLHIVEFERTVLA